MKIYQIPDLKNKIELSKKIQKHTYIFQNIKLRDRIEDQLQMMRYWFKIVLKLYPRKQLRQNDRKWKLRDEEDSLWLECRK